MDNIKHIFEGLPEYLKNRVLWVNREFRTNKLSHEPGGSDVVVEYHSSEVFGYDWIKYPKSYIYKIISKKFTEKYGGFNEYDLTKQLIIIKKEIKKIFARKYTKENFATEPFTEIWNSETSNESPFKLLENFNAE